jgi:hypothetical protein
MQRGTNGNISEYFSWTKNAVASLGNAGINPCIMKAIIERDDPF